MGKYDKCEKSVNGPKTHKTTFAVANRSGQPLLVKWLDFQHRPKQFAKVEAGGLAVQNTFNTHTWVIEDEQGEVWHSYRGESTVMLVKGPDKAAFEGPPKPNCDSYDHPDWGHYCKRRDVHGGIGIKCYECIDPKALDIAETTIGNMLARCHPEIMGRLRKFKAAVAIVGEKQETTAFPEYALERYKKGKTGRGLGGNRSRPICVVGEENILFSAKNKHGAESILVHEFAHNVMNIGFDAKLTDEVKQLHQQARQSGNFRNDSYIMKNKDEFWAEASQAWFEATTREDVTSGMCTRWHLANRFPELAALMLRVYGRNEWLYPHTAPKPFGKKAPPCAGKSLDDIEERIAHKLNQDVQQVRKLGQHGSNNGNHGALPQQHSGGSQQPSTKQNFTDKASKAGSFLRSKFDKFMER